MTRQTELIQPDRGQDAHSIHLVNRDCYPEWVRTLSAGQRAALDAQKFDGGGYQTAIVPDGDSWFAVGGVANPESLSSWCLAKLAEILPEGTYRVADHATGPALFGWQTAQYTYDRYRTGNGDTGPRILLTADVNAIPPAIAEAQAVNLVCDLVNTPAEDMGPAALEAEAEALAKSFDARLNIVRGDTLEQDYPMVHAVGRAASRHHAPRLIHLEWGKKGNPVVAFVGKGVCFDSGGLDIKNAKGMRLMKKDMGGAAHAIALAHLVMNARLPVHLHLLVPAVENAVSGSAFRPGDVLKSRQGLSVEIGNTDAEGRLVLADALTRASEEKPDLIIDFATLTGAARVALGPDLPALFARRDETAQAMISAGKANDDPCWQMPLHPLYADWLASEIADLGNAHDNGFAGATVAALFLDRFVGKNIDWVHFDTFAWRPFARPGRKTGGAAYGLRASWHMLQQRYGSGQFSK
ncbi:MAG: leucyl aminopeptidase family protein [Sphingomonadaceae bacterium]